MEENRFFKQAFETVNENDCKVGDTVDAFNKKVNDSGVCPTVTTRPEWFKTAILVVDEPIIYDDFNGRIKSDQSAISCQTTNCGNDAPRNGVKIIEPITEYELSDKMKKYINSYNNKYKVNDGNLVDNKVTAGAVTTREGCTRADASSYISKDFSENTNIAGKDMTRYRVRKLTEKECFKLMGVKVEDFEKIRSNQSKSSCYHLAGDSIVSTVLMALLGQMLDIDWKEKVNKTVNSIIIKENN